MLKKISWDSLNPFTPINHYLHATVCLSIVHLFIATIDPSSVNQSVCCITTCKHYPPVASLRNTLIDGAKVSKVLTILCPKFVI